MTSAVTTLILQDILRRESRSLLEYTVEAFPWTPAQEHSAAEQLAKLTAEECQALNGLAALLARRRVPLPYIGPFPEPFTALNFSSLDHLLPRLVEEEHKNIAVLERELARLIDPEAAAAVRKLLELKQRHLKTLESLATGHPQASAAATPAAH
jgi:rubrerythrin